jgi:cell division protein FtsW (lipid II flippase)
MGGTSLFMNSIGFGIILGISKYIEEEKQQQNEAITAGI